MASGALDTIRTYPGTLRGVRVLVRVDYNTSVIDGVVQSTYRILKTLPTISYLRQSGARIILATHSAEKPPQSLGMLSGVLQKFIPHTFVSDIIGRDAKMAIEGLKDGEVLLIDNLRLHEGEKTNDGAFARSLASHAELYVNEAFSTSHRPHASLVGVPRFLPHTIGLQCAREITELSRVHDAKRPLLCIFGGAKFETKVPLIKKFLPRADKVFVGGMLVNEFFRVLGYPVGRSMLPDVRIDISREVKDPKLVIPSDVEVRNGSGIFVRRPNEVKDEDFIVDVGPETMSELGELVERAHTILWNGPLGNYERGFRQHTGELASIIAASQAHTIVGGGDTLSSVEELGIADKFSFLSTAGGAMIEFLLNGSLPGLDAVL